MRARVGGGLALAVWIATAAAAAGPRLVLDPERTEIRFRLGATLHTVEGTAALESGEIELDLASGVASGEILVDARSLETGNAKRDRIMHGRILESEAFPRISFVAERIEGALSEDGASQIRLHGELRLHGAVHQTVVEAEVRPGGETWEATARFSVPYVAMGLEDPSKLVLRVAKEVEVEIRLSARLDR